MFERELAEDISATIGLRIRDTSSGRSGNRRRNRHRFFPQPCRNLSDALGTYASWVTEYLPAENKLKALAMWMNGGFVEHYEYCLPGTPCEPVVEQKTVIHFPEKIIELFPGDAKILTDVGAVSFMGVPLLDLDGEVLGHLAILDTKPMPGESRSIALFEIFAARAAAEHRRLKAENELKEREEQLTMLIDSAMDAIVVLDSSLNVTRSNRAAERCFGCTNEDLVGESINEFLSPGKRKKGRKFHSRYRGTARRKTATLGASGFCRPTLGPFHLSS